LNNGWKKKFEDFQSKQNQVLADARQEQEKLNESSLAQLRKVLEDEKEVALRVQVKSIDNMKGVDNLLKRNTSILTNPVSFLV